MALIGDNCATKKPFANCFCTCFVECASHRFNLDFKDLIEGLETAINLVRKLMQKLRNLIPSAKLRKVTRLRPKCGNATRWSSTFEMLARYQELKPVRKHAEIDELEELHLTKSQKREVETLCHMLSELNGVKKPYRRTTLLYLMQEPCLMWSLKIIQ